MPLKVFGARVGLPTIVMSATKSFSITASMTLFGTLFGVLVVVRVILDYRVCGEGVD